MIEWVLVLFLYIPAKGVMEGTPLERYKTFNECMAAAKDLQGKVAEDEQFMCWVSKIEDKPV